MITLTEFLLARIAEDRAGALLARDGDDWHTGGECNVCDQTYVARAEYGNPVRVLAETEAKRRMVTALSEKSAEHWGPREVPEREWEWCPKVRTAEFCQGTDLEWGPGAPCECAASRPDHRRAPLLRLLALPYANHQDYRSEWKPS